MTPEQARAHLAAVRLGEKPLPSVLLRVADVAAASVPGAVEASLTVEDETGARTVAHTGALALALDERQYALGWGPCLDCLAGGEVAHVDDTSSETRWPGFTEAARAKGIGSALAVPLPLQRDLCASLNLYGVAAGAFDAAAIAQAQDLAAHAGVALANAHLYEVEARRAAQLQEAMASRAVIEQAKGVLIARHRITAQAAFDVLVRQSQATNRKLRDLAAELVQEASGA